MTLENVKFDSPPLLNLDKEHINGHVKDNTIAPNRNENKHSSFFSCHYSHFVEIQGVGAF